MILVLYDYGDNETIPQTTITSSSKSQCPGGRWKRVCGGRNQSCETTSLPVATSPALPAAASITVSTTARQ